MRDFSKGPFLCVDKDNTEVMFDFCPIRDVNGKGYWTLCNTGIIDGASIVLPKGTIKKLIGKDMSWKNNPVKLKIDQ